MVAALAGAHCEEQRRRCCFWSSFWHCCTAAYFFSCDFFCKLPAAPKEWGSGCSIWGIMAAITRNRCLTQLWPPAGNDLQAHRQQTTNKQGARAALPPPDYFAPLPSYGIHPVDRRLRLLLRFVFHPTPPRTLASTLVMIHRVPLTSLALYLIQLLVSATTVSATGHRAATCNN